MYNFGELKTNSGYLAQRDGDTTYLNSQMEVYLNLSQDFLAKIYDYYHELKGVHNFTTVDGTALYYMPSDFDKPLRFYDITNDKPIKINTEEEYFDSNIANIADANEADADTAYFKEVVGVKAQVSTSGDTVQAKSSSALDTSEIVRIEGYLDSDLTIVGYENITVTGTSAVAGTTTFYKILGFSKTSDTNGFITLEDSSGNDLGILAKNERVARYKAFRLGRIPDDSTTNMRVLYKRKVRKLVHDNDYPFIDADHFLIFNAAAMSLSENKENVQVAANLMNEAQKALNALLTNVQGKLGPSFQHKLQSSFLQAHRA